MFHPCRNYLFQILLLSALLACSDQSGQEPPALSAPVTTLPDPDNSGRTPASVVEPSDDDEWFEPDLSAMTEEELAEYLETLEPAAGGIDHLDFYTIKVAADTKLQIPGGKGELRVWIGDEGFSPVFDSSMNEASGLLPALGNTAKVEAYAPDFEVEPNTSQCIILHPTGSEVRFHLTPKQAGVYKVGANVNLYHSDDCSGAAIPKTAESLQVSVDVNSKALREGKQKELFDIFWEKLLDFWGALLALLFGLILFLVRDKLKKLFGFEPKD